jgi:RNA polymerase sigma-70 factor (ECF subfamily)
MSDADKHKSLLVAAIAGDATALERLLLGQFAALEHHIMPRIPTHARCQIDAEDILQEVFVQAFRDISKFRNRYDGSFFAWLTAIADNRLADSIKRIGRIKRGGDQHRCSSIDGGKTSTIATLIDIVCYDSHRPEESVQRHEIDKAIQVALATLPPNQRKALHSRYILGQDVNEIAVQMRLTEAAVRGLIKRGKDNLAEAMGRASQWLSTR